MDYFDWNSLIARHFFNEDMAGNSVYLNVTEALVNELGAPYSQQLSNFIDDLKAGPDGLTGRGRPGLACDKALKLLQDWRTKGSNYPPYIAYLALFVLATNKDGDYSVRAYHPRLRQLLNPSDDSRATYPSFDETYKLWSDLEQWANKDQQGQLGLFNADIVGQHFHIGLPRAQVLLTESELKQLPEFFIAAGLSNDSSPSDAELLKLLATHAATIFRPQIRNLLQHDSQAQELIAKIVSDKLWEWDSTDIDTQGPRAFGALFLSLGFDEFSGVVMARVHAKSRQVLPEEGLLLNSANNQEYSASGAGSWSSPIHDASHTTITDASTMPWERNVRLADTAGRWSFSWVGSLVRIFVHGSAFGVSGMAEVKQLSPETPFWLAAHPSAVSDIAAWGSTSCEGFTELQVNAGLPTGWRLYAVAKVLDDSLVKNNYPLLAIPDGARFHLLGGIPIRGNRYFVFAPPTVAVSSSKSELFELLCDGAPLSGYCKEGLTYFDLPLDVAADRYLQLQLKFNSEVVQTRYLFLDSKMEVPPNTGQYRADKFGNPGSEANWISGASVNSTTPSCPFALFGMVKVPRRLILLGDRPGEITSYARTGYPENWEPSWILINGRKIVAMPCSYESVSTSSTENGGKHRKRWREVLWHRRKRMSLKTDDEDKRLKWQTLRNLARDKWR